MSLYQTALRAELCQTLERLETLLNECAACIRDDEDLPAWLWQATGGVPMRLTAAQAMRQIEYDDGQDPSAVIMCPGLLGASAATLDRARELNLAKDQLRSVLVTMEKIRVQERDPVTGEVVKMSLARFALHAMGRARLHRHQAWRHWRLLEAMPEGIGFTWAHTRKVKRIDVDTAQRWLADKGDSPSILQQRELLAPLPSDQPLAYIKKSPTHVRVNLTWGPGEKAPQASQVCAALPVLFPCRPGQALPPFAALRQSSEADPGRRRRRDRKVEETPFLPAIHVYRYLPEHG